MFEQRIFGPLRLDKLARQIKTQDREHKRHGKLLGTRLRHQVAEAERKSETEDAYLEERLSRIPNLAQSLRQASGEVKRQTFEAFGLRIEFDKAGRRIEISATIAEAVASAFENTKALQTEGFQVTVNEIAGAGFEPATFGL